MHNPISEAVACIAIGCLFPLVVVGFLAMMVGELYLSVAEA